VAARLPLSSGDPDESPNHRRARWGIRAVVVLPLTIGAITVLAKAGGGLYWIAAGIALGIVAAIANAWVLLVEILR
jgi:hypothetical protein